MADSTSGSTPAREKEAFRGSSQAGGGQRDWGSGVGEHERNEAARAGENVAGWAATAADKAKEVGEEAKSLANRAKEKVKDWAQTTGEKAKDLAHTAGEKVDTARTSVGEGLESFGGSIREKGSTASSVVGGKLEAAGHYLREHDFSGMAESMKDVVRRHPVQSVFVGIGLGFVLARAMRRG
jgi:ElaB/YqjD/DUF883 family membrane-anchored ribosome-binding protein